MKPQSCNVLIIDDDYNIFKIIELNLPAGQYTLTYAKNGREALHLVEKTRFDIILIDLLMPEMDGLSLFETLKPCIAVHTMVILVTADVLEQHLMQAVDKGIYDIIQKPFTANRLKLTIRNAWNHKRLLDKYQPQENIIDHEN